MNTVRTGLLAGLPLAAVFAVYFVARGQAFATMMKAEGGEIAALSDGTLRLLFLAGFVFAALLFGVLATVVYKLVGSPLAFLALGLAALLSVAAVASKTPLPADKVVWNFAVALVLGLLVPFLARALV